jgi:hypothetical protein
MSFDDLLSVVTPPTEPLDNRGDWGQVVTQIGLTLPVDYMQFVESFGSGSLNDFIYVLNPFATNNNLNLLYKLTQLLGGLRELKKEHPELVPYPLLFEPAGLFPWGLTDNGDMLGWITRGETGHWPSILLPRHASKTAEFWIPMTALLAGLLSGKVVCDLLSRDLFVSAPRFTSAKSKTRS